MNATEVDGFESAVATVAFVDLAGFSAIADVYGDASAIAVLGRFEALVREALGGHGSPIKWIGDEAMFGFPDPATTPHSGWRSMTSRRMSPPGCDGFCIGMSHCVGCLCYRIDELWRCAWRPPPGGRFT